MSWASRLYFWKRLVSFAIHKGPLVGDIDDVRHFQGLRAKQISPGQTMEKDEKDEFIESASVHRMLLSLILQWLIVSPITLRPQLRLDARADRRIINLYHKGVDKTSAA